MYGAWFKCECSHIRSIHVKDGHGGCAKCECEKFAREHAVFKTFAEPAKGRHLGTRRASDGSP